MFKTLSWIVVASALVASCSTSEPNTDVTKEDTAITAPSRSSAPAEDTDLLLARKWQSESGTMLIDLNLDGSFVGELDGRPIEGSWSISDDRNELTVSESKGVDGKGQALQQTYTILSNSSESMVLQDTEGKEWALTALE